MLCLFMYLFIYLFFLFLLGKWLKVFDWRIKLCKLQQSAGRFLHWEDLKKKSKNCEFPNCIGFVENPIPVNIKKFFRSYWIAHGFSVNSFFPCSFCVCKTSLLWLTVRFMDRRFSERSKTLVSYGIHACSLDLMQYSNYVTHCGN